MLITLIRIVTSLLESSSKSLLNLEVGLITEVKEGVLSFFDLLQSNFSIPCSGVLAELLSQEGRRCSVVPLFTREVVPLCFSSVPVGCFISSFISIKTAVGSDFVEIKELYKWPASTLLLSAA